MDLLGHSLVWDASHGQGLESDRDIFIAVYVDDILLAGNNLADLTS